MAEDDDEAARAANNAMRRDSERLLKAVDELRALEREKRQLAISSRTFDELAERVEQKEREVFRLAGQEEADGRIAEGVTGSDPAAVDQPIDREPVSPAEGGTADRA
jgi:signal transduction histidine kinase